MRGTNAYKHVFQPIKIRQMTAKNRIMIPPMLSCLATPDGKVTPEIIAFARAMAKTGAGIVTLGESNIDHDRSMDHVAALNIGDDTIIPGLVHLAEEIHRYGAKASIELNHGGALANEALLNGRPRIAPSPFPESFNFPRHRGGNIEVMDKAMIKQVARNYADAVHRCMLAGFDMVMIHAAHGWLLGQFLSPTFNQRTDEYGGSLENRMRFPLAVLQAIRDKCGDGIVLDMRVSGSSRVVDPPREMEIDDVLEFLQVAQKYIDIVNFSSSYMPRSESLGYMIPTYFLPHKVNAVFAEKAKKVLNIPVTAVGSITSVAEAEELIAEGKADVVAIGRAGLADSFTFVKAYRGQEDKIRPCLRCSYCGDRGRPFVFRAVRCAVNPRVGRELEYPFIPKASAGKKVMIIGGGPAGMQAAQTAVERGHDVTLHEKSDNLGGLLHIASSLPFKHDMKRYMEWMIKETMNCGAKIVLNTEITPELVAKENPDVVLVAIGSVPSIPPIPGITGTNVIWAGDVGQTKVINDNKVAVAGAGLTGAEYAITLAQAGKDVTLIDMIPESEFAKDAPGVAVISMNELFSSLKIKRIFDSVITEITESGLKYTDKNSNHGEIRADIVIYALGMRVEESKVQALLSVIPETYLIGDCNGGPKNIVNAITSAFTYALEI